MDFGKYGPHLMMVASLPFLWTKRTLLNYTLVGFCLNLLLNTVLKFIFHCPRPDNDNALFTKLVKQTTFLESVESDPFGFPSGHSQNSAFIAAMMYYFAGLKPITIFMVTYTLFIMWQRVSSKRHYLYQVVGGAIVGIAFATGVHYSYKNHLVGKILHKLDDWSRKF
jgi:membrane-associated phospholipid phosphatase